MSSMRNPSEAYARSLKEAQEHHRRSKTWNGSLMIRHAGSIKYLIDRLDCRSVLDYGCGKAFGYLGNYASWDNIEAYWGVPVTKIDPGVPEDFKRMPGVPRDHTIGTEMPARGKWDLIIVTHALGSIPVEDLKDWVVPMLHRRANKAIFVAENLNAPKKDHLFTTTDDKPRQWTARQWMDLLEAPKSDVVVEAWFRGTPGNDPRVTGDGGPEFRQWPFED